AGVLALNGRPLDEIPGAKRSPWARDQDWGVTIEKTFPRALGAITEGKSWQADYDGPPLMALSDWQAKIFKLSVGNSMTLSIEGRAVTAKIAALYKENWDREGLNFTAVFAPGTLEAANPSSVASLRTPDLASESIIARSVAEEFPNVTVIRTREVAQSIADILSNIGLAIRVLTGVTILAGVVVLFGAIASDFAGKLRDAMIMRTIGASRRRILAAHAVEYAALGAAPALAALALGAFGSWYVVAKRMDIEWTPSPSLLLAIVLGAVVTTLAMGLAAAATALGGRPWPVLRSE
ncbi:MAG TPA: FtsX-like permease family protein, partial [Parvularculaceae bacterium]|nr:FtsX-like permease family protein [Parvularculaceae bacterium]